jgi:hypothetical protein
MGIGDNEWTISICSICAVLCLSADENRNSVNYNKSGG